MTLALTHRIENFYHKKMQWKSHNRQTFITQMTIKKIIEKAIDFRLILSNKINVIVIEPLYHQPTCATQSMTSYMAGKHIIKSIEAFHNESR